MDTNKDGEISKEEFLMAVLPLGEFSNHRRLYIGWKNERVFENRFQKFGSLSLAVTGLVYLINLMKMEMELFHLVNSWLKMKSETLVDSWQH